MTVSLIQRLKAFALAAVLVAATAIALPRPAVAQDWIGDFLERLASNQDRNVVIEGFEGSVRGRARIRRLTVADPQGIWLTAEGVVLNLRPLDLARRRLAVDELSAERITVERTPVSADGASPPGGQGGGLPELPVAVNLDRLSVGELVLKEGAPAGPATVAVDGQLRYATDRVAGRLHLVRRDAPGEARVEGDYAPGEDRLALDVNAQEPAGGLIARALNLPDQPPVRIEVKGQGPLSGWRGTLDAAAGDLLSAQGGVTVARVEGGYRIGVDLGADVHRLLPPPADALAGPGVRLAGTVVTGPGGRILFDALRMSSAAATATLAGVLETQAGRLDLGIDATAGPDSALRGVAKADWRQLRIEARAAGPLRQPDVTARATVDGVDGFGIVADRLAADVRATLLSPVDQGLPSADLTALVTAEGLDTPVNGQVGPMVGAAPRIEARGRLDGAARKLAVTTLTADIAAGRLADGAGTADLDSGQAEFQARLLLPDLARLRPLVPLELAGDANLVLKAATGGAGTPVAVDVNGVMEGLRLGIPAVDALLGSRTTLAAGLRRTEDGALRGEGVRVDGTHGHATAEVVLAEGRLSVDWTAVVPDLAPVALAVNAPVSGGVSAAGTLSGPTDALQLAAKVTAPDLAAAGVPLGPAEVDANVDLSGGLGGRVALSANPRGVPARVATDFRLREKRLALANLAISGPPGVALAGNATVNLEGGLVEGRLAGNLDRLQALEPLIGQPIAGRGRVELALDAANGAQQAGLRATAQDLSAAGMTVQGAELVARVVDALRAPRVDARLTASGAQIGGTAVRRFTAQAQGTPADLSFQADAEGAAGRPEAPATLALAGRYAGSGEGHRVELSRLRGRYADAAFALRQPATVLAAPGRIAVRNLSLTGPDGSGLTAQGALEGDRLSGEADIRRLPLALARLVAPSAPMTGTLDGRITLGGTLVDPQATARLATRDARVDTAVGAAAASAQVDASVRGGQARADARVRLGDGNADLAANVAVPVRVNLAEGRFALGEGQPLSGALTGQVNLALINDFLAASGDRAGGQATLDLRLSGTPADPRYGGAVTVAGGSYSNLSLGTQVTDIAGRIAGNGDQLSVQNFTGRTPNGGRLALSGVVRPLAGQLDLRLSARNAQLVRIDLVTAAVNADISAVGGFDGLLVAGPVDIARAEIQVPDRAPVSVVDLSVFEVNRAQGLRGRVPVPGRNPRYVAATANAGRQTDPAAGGGDASLTRRIALDIPIRANNQIFLRGRGVDAELRSDIHVGGTAAEPRITGGLSLLRGKLDVLAQSFELTQADVRFQGDGGRIDPQLNVAAQARKRDLTAEVRVTGSASSPRFRLTSQPELPQEEILSRVLFDKPLGELSAFEAAQMAQGAAQLAGVDGGGPGVMDRIRRGLGLDRLEFGGGGSDGSGGRGEDGGGGVQAGRYITDRVYVGVEQDFRGESRARVELEVFNNVRIQSSVGPSSGTDVGVTFQWDY
ncbi:MAG TPA: translocation/assembly module TamB domain-containing protein [Azospirillaceae bacterium]|nr:translocation/assembly module TamB domain-containing protein [Azospirillaceae bacterium]